MTCRELTLTFDQFALATSRPRADRAFRIVLQPGEVLRLPRKAWTIRVFSGDAWIAHSGIDHTVAAGGSLALAKGRHPAIISAEHRPLCLEIA
jgi:hypothetical protein